MDPVGYIPVEGGRVWYKIVGPSKPGVPLLTLHGGPGYPHDYLEPLEQLADARPVIFYDQLGCGKSDQPPDRTLWRMERFVCELAQVRQALGFASMHLFGHSWGTMLAVDYLLTGASVTSLILASPALSIPRWMADADRLRKMLPADVQETLARHEAAGTTNTRQYRDATMDYYRRHLCRMDPWPDPMSRSHEASSGVIYREMWGPSELCATGNLMNYDETGRLCEIAVPTLYTCGRYDEATPEATACYRSLTPATEMLVFEQSAHMPHLEETHAYLAALRRFLDRINKAVKPQASARGPSPPLPELRKGKLIPCMSPKGCGSLKPKSRSCGNRSPMSGKKPNKPSPINNTPFNRSSPCARRSSNCTPKNKPPSST